MMKFKYIRCLVSVESVRSLSLSSVMYAEVDVCSVPLSYIVLLFCVLCNMVFIFMHGLMVNPWVKNHPLNVQMFRLSLSSVVCAEVDVCPVPLLNISTSSPELYYLNCTTFTVYFAIHALPHNCTIRTIFAQYSASNPHTNCSEYFTLILVGFQYLGQKLIQKILI